MATSRRRVAGLAATAITIPMLFPAAAGATASFGQSNDPVKPPAPKGCHGYLWTNTQGERLSIENPRIVIPGLVKPAGIIDITEVIAFDLRHGDHGDAGDGEADGAAVAPEPEAPAPELYEKLRIEFWKGDTLLGATTNTPDLLDDKMASWMRTPLGRVDIFEEADRVEIVHASQFMGTDETMNAFMPMSVCITWKQHYTDNAVGMDRTCNKATVRLSNNGTAKANLRVIADGKSTDYLVKPYGGTQVHEIALREDTNGSVKVIDLDTQAVLLDQKWFTDCVAPAPATTTTHKTVVNAVVSTPATPEVQPQVLGTQVTAATQPQLARTGSQAATNAGIGATLVAFGYGLMTLGRRRKAQA
jgi:hypothetical protein